MKEMTKKAKKTETILVKGRRIKVSTIFLKEYVQRTVDNGKNIERQLELLKKQL